MLAEEEARDGDEESDDLEDMAENMDGAQQGRKLPGKKRPRVRIGYDEEEENEEELEYEYEDESSSKIKNKQKETLI